MNGSRRKAGLATGLVVALAATGFALGGTATSQAEVDLRYLCAFPLGDKDVGVRVQAEFPDEVPAGSAVQPERVTVTTTVPKSALALPAASTVSGTAQLTTEITRNGATSSADWPGLAVPDTPVDDDGDTLLTASGPVPAAETRAPGTLSFAARDLTLNLVPSDPQHGQVTVTCTLKPDQDGHLATVRVVSATPSPTTPAPTASGPPYGCFVIPPEKDRFQACAVFTGFANVRKLNAALALNDGSLQKAAPIGVLYGSTGAGGMDLAVRFRFARPMRSRATFLTYTFMPVTATVELRQEGTGTMLVTGQDVQRVSGSLRVSLRLSDVTLNGTPMDVGRNCRTATPIRIDLSEVPGQPFRDILNEERKALHSRPFTVPRFTGCVAGREDLTRLFDAAISGPGNYLKITLGRVIRADREPPVPEPYR